MKKTLFVSLIFLFLNASESLAQDEKYNSISLNWGYGNIMRQDKSFSPMIHKKSSPINLLFEYNRSKNTEQQAYIKFGLYKPIVGEEFTFNYHDGKKETTYPHSFYLVDINYALGKNILEKGKWKLALGGKVRNRLMASDYLFGNAGSFGYYFTFGLNVWTKINFDLNEKHHFVSHVTLPLFSFNARSPYNSQNDQYFIDSYSHKPFKTFNQYIKGGELQSWGKSQSFDFDVSYYYTLSEKWEIGGKYLLSMDFNQNPTKFAQLENVFYLSGKLKF